jgi:hypothetical protein
MLSPLIDLPHIDHFSHIVFRYRLNLRNSRNPQWKYLQLVYLGLLGMCNFMRSGYTPDLL